MIECTECGREFDSEEIPEEHFPVHQVEVISAEPLVIRITLPDGATPGRSSAAIAFSDAIGVIHRSYPNRRFSYTTFDHERSNNFGGVTSWLAIADRESDE